MSAWADECIKKYGAELCVKSAETPAGRTGRGFISPAAPRDGENAWRALPPGYYNRERYLLTASRDAIADGETERSVSCGGAEYELLRVELVKVGDEVSHWEGVMRLKGGAKDA